MSKPDVVSDLSSGLFLCNINNRYSYNVLLLYNINLEFLYKKRVKNIG